MLKTKKKTNKKKGKKYNTSKDLPPDQSSLKMKILRASFTPHSMSNCLNSRYVPLDPSLYRWKLVETRWESIWLEGSPLPHPDYAVDESGKVDETRKAEVSGTINESEIIESDEALFGEFEEISENYNGQKNVVTALSMLILAVIPMMMLM